VKAWLCLLLLIITGSAGAQQRIIALAPHITEMLFAIGAGDQLVGVSDFSDYPDAATRLPRVASYASINLEAVLALQPDLVIAWRSGNPPADVQRLQQFGIKVVFSDPRTLDDIAAELHMLGEVTGHQAQANTEAGQFRQQLTALRTEFQQKRPIPVFFAMGTAPLSTVANLAWPQQMLAVCAAKNIFSDVKGDYPLVGLEQIIAAKPEIIIQPTRPDTSPDQNFWRRFTNLPAVKKSQFLPVNADLLFRTTPRTILGIRQLCQGIDSFR